MRLSCISSLIQYKKPLPESDIMGCALLPLFLYTNAGNIDDRNRDVIAQNTEWYRTLGSRRFVAGFNTPNNCPRTSERVDVKR